MPALRHRRREQRLRPRGSVQRMLKAGTSAPTPTATWSAPRSVGRARTSSRSRAEWPPASAWVKTPPRRSSPAAWRRSSGWASRSAPKARRWPGWRAWVTWWPPVPPRGRATGRSAMPGPRRDHGVGDGGEGLPRRRGGDVLRVGARPGGQLRRRNAAHRRRAPGVSQEACRWTKRWRCCWAAAPSPNEAPNRRKAQLGPAPHRGAPQPVASLGCECQRR